MADPKEPDEITLDHLGGQITFNRKMFKDSDEWRDFKARAADIARSATETPGETGLRHYNEIAGHSGGKSETKHERDLREHKIVARGPAGERMDKFPAGSLYGETKHEPLDKKTLDEINAREQKRLNADWEARKAKYEGSPEGGTHGIKRFVEQGMGAQALESGGEGGGGTSGSSPDWAAAKKDLIPDLSDPAAQGGAGGGPAEGGAEGGPAGNAPMAPVQDPAQADWTPPVRAAGAVSAMTMGPAIQGLAKAGIDPLGLNPSAPSPPAPGAPPPDAGGPPPPAPAAAPNLGVPAGPDLSDIKGAPRAAEIKKRFDDLTSQYNEAARSAADIQAYRADVNRHAVERHAAGVAETQRKQREMQEYVEGSQRDVLSNAMKARDILSDPVKTPDPERYWKNHSKALFAIGVALTAAGKGDVGAIVGRVHGQIAEDVAAQKAAFEAPRDAAKAQLEADDKLFAMLRNHGLDSYEADKYAQAILTDRLNADIKKNAASSESALIRANATQAITLNEQKIMKDESDVMAHTTANAHARIAAYNAQTQRMTAEKDRQGAGAEPVPEQPLQKLTNIPTALDSLGRLFKAYKESGPASPNKNSQYDLSKEAEAGSMAAGNTPNARENAELMKDFKKGLPTEYTPNWNGKHYFADSMRAMLENADNQISVLENSKKYDKGQIGTLRKEVDAARDRLIRQHPELRDALPNSIPTSPVR